MEKEGIDNMFNIQTPGGYGQEIAGYNDLSKVQEQNAKDTANYWQGVQDLRTQQVTDLKAKYTDVNDKMNNIIDDYSKKNVSIDNYFANSGTAGKVMAGLAIILGGIGQSQGAGKPLGVKTNIGLDVVNNAINRDIEIQKANLEKGGAVAKMQTGILSDSLKQFGDMQMAELGAKMTIGEKLKAELQQNSANPMTKIAIGQIENQQAQWQQQMKLAMYKTMGPSIQAQQAGQQIDNLFGQASKLGLSAKVPLTEGSEAVKGINAQLLSMIGMVNSPRLAKEIGNGSYITAKDLMDPHAMKAKRERIKQLLNYDIQAKSKTPGIGQQLEVTD